MASANKGRGTGRHRAEELPVRRWLQLGAASAGVGAALLGWSLIGSETPAASADSGVDGSSASAGPAASPAGGVESRSASSSAPKASSSSGDDAGPSSTSRQTARTATAQDEDAAEPADAVGRAERRGNSLRSTANPVESSSAPKAGGSASVADRLADSTSVGSRLASRTAAAPDVNAFGTAVTGLFNGPAAEPAAAPGGNITFEFNYGKGAESWTPERRRELEQSAASLAQYLNAPIPVKITYNVSGEDDPNSRTLAFAGSNLAGGDYGFDNTVVQEKLISGLDLNGPEDDGYVTFNFANDYGLGYKVGDDQYDFVSTAIHELVHSLGFFSGIGPAGDNNERYWPVFAGFVVDDRGTRAIGPDYAFDTALDANLVGWNGGLYFGGPNAVAAYGRPVPLFTPDPFQSGSSLSHLNQLSFVGPDAQMMNPEANKVGNDRRTLSAIEQGILADIGYQINFQGPAPYAPPVAGAFLGFLLLRRRRKPEASGN
ncbi:hypothetical protein A5757_01755 [Mycobacterium sp. 852013-51886_SCH5428379]|uniref:hypothetical protein n=1 Tax=Mycobacterium sp. 852013-51886_SCH5428379 TaxID=1834111 RepID=UPI0007FFCF6E|nr:hypothetical protein [Mycobacterium sp. 852013-51886_SCH5428379]OBB56245.1 hypothetical protein A5757_01755 [Mycobacterium sp. 852013-51886_SCH5428379]